MWNTYMDKKSAILQEIHKFIASLIVFCNRNKIKYNWHSGTMYIQIINEFSEIDLISIRTWGDTTPTSKVPQFTEYISRSNYSFFFMLPGNLRFVSHFNFKTYTNNHWSIISISWWNIYKQEPLIQINKCMWRKMEKLINTCIIKLL